MMAMMRMIYPAQCNKENKRKIFQPIIRSFWIFKNTKTEKNSEKNGQLLSPAAV